MMKIYLAGRYGRRKELLGYALDLAEAGHTVTSRWLTGAHEIPEIEYTDSAYDSMPDAEREQVARQWAEDDLEDIRASEMLIAFTEVPDSGESRGGRHVELGYALALGLQVIVIGPRENVFCCLPEVWHCETRSEAIGRIAEWEKNHTYYLPAVEDDEGQTRIYRIRPQRPGPPQALPVAVARERKRGEQIKKAATHALLQLRDDFDCGENEAVMRTRIQSAFDEIGQAEREYLYESDHA